MKIEGLDTMNTWLAIIAIVSVLQILALATVAWLGYRLYSRAMTLLNEIEAKHVAPLTARAHHVLDELQQITARVKGAEEAVLDKLRVVAATGSHAVAIAKARSWPIVGIIRAAQAGLSVLLNRHESDTAPRPGSADFNRPTTLRPTGSL